MGEYRKKPVVIEAFQYDGDLMDRNGKPIVPDWAFYAIANGVLYYENDGELWIKTLEGDHHASVGDFIIRGVHGEFYPCKPDIFAKTYEVAYSPKTNADRIRAMSDEELADFITDKEKGWCTDVGREMYYQHNLEWLKQPAEVDKDA